MQQLEKRTRMSTASLPQRIISLKLFREALFTSFYWHGQSINADSKSNSNDGFFKTIHEQASITSARTCTGSKMANKHCTRKQLQGELNETRKTSRRWRVAFLQANDRYVYSRLGCAYHYPHQSSSATLNLQPSSVLRVIPNIVPVKKLSFAIGWN